MSERREQRRIERTAGTGTVLREGVPIGTASYVMEVWQTFHVISGLGPDPEEEVAGMKELNIQFLRHDLDTFKLWHDRATLTLRLQDGRQLDGFINGEEFVASGQMTTA